MSTEKKGIIYIDIEGGIKKWNEQHPELKPLNKTIVAEKVGLTPVSIGKYQKGDTPNILRDIDKFRELFGMNYDELVKTK